MMNRELWNKSITEYSTPPWPCPVCGIGVVALVKGSSKFVETIASNTLKNQGISQWEPDWIEYAFTSWGKCRHNDCAQEFSISGKGSYEMVFTEDGPDYERRFYPLHCYPMPDIFDVPTESPDDVQQVLRQAFSLFWGNTAACANRLRLAIELLLDHVGIQRKKKSSNNKFFQLSLHQRIEIFKRKDKNVANKLMALKWLGNTGSHFVDAKKTDLLDAFEILEYSLAEILGNRSERVEQLAKNLMTKHKKIARR